MSSNRKSSGFQIVKGINIKESSESYKKRYISNLVRRMSPTQLENVKEQILARFVLLEEGDPKIVNHAFNKIEKELNLT